MLLTTHGERFHQIIEQVEVLLQADYANKTCNDKDLQLLMRKRRYIDTMNICFVIIVFQHQF